jgi:hypothetical protein
VRTDSMIECDYQLSAEDVRAAWRAHTPAGAASLVILPACGAVLVLLALMLLHFDSSDRGSWVWLFVGLFFLSVSALTNLRVRARWRRHASALTPVHLEVDEEGLHWTTRNAESRCTWEAIVDTQEAPDHFLLYLTPESYVTTPKRAFASDLDLDRFAGFLGRKVTARRWG